MWKALEVVGHNGVRAPAGREALMDIRVMGNVEIHDGSHPIPLPRAGERCVLASLALDPGRRIRVDSLIDRLWSDHPPGNAGQTIASYVRTVRKAIEDAGGKREWLRNYRPAAYQLDIDPSLVDYHRFSGLVRQARAQQRDRNPAAAVGYYQQALALRTGEALGNVTGDWAANRRYAIEQEHLETVCALYEQQLAVGDYTAVATHATELVMHVVPTDRLIVLALHGLARSGQHAAIRGLVSRATRRMWDTARARPSAQVVALARQLIADPAAPLPAPPAGSHESAPPEPYRGGQVVMTAEHNQQVYQAAGDQYITEA